MDMPMNGGDAASAMPTDGSSPAQDGGNAGGPVDEICIARYADGTFRVYLESAQDESGEMAGGESGEGDKGEQVETFEQALKMAVKLNRDTPAGGDVQAQFQAGYQSERGA